MAMENKNRGLSHNFSDITIIVAESSEFRGFAQRDKFLPLRDKGHFAVHIR